MKIENENENRQRKLIIDRVMKMKNCNKNDNFMWKVLDIFDIFE
jgi:hypothetical protein